MPGVRGFERVRSSRAGDKGTTMEELDGWADGPQADRPREELSLADRVWADRPRADRSWGLLLQTEEDQVDDPPTDPGKSHGSAEQPTVFLVLYLCGH